MPKPRNADGGRLAPAMNLNSVKVYNLSSVGKALPAWLSAGKRKALVQKKEDNERRSSLSKLAVVAPPLATRRSSDHRLWLWALFRRSAHAQPSALLTAGKPRPVHCRHFPPRSDSRLEVIQELWFPTSCGRVKFSADGESMIATGCYPPQSRLYELRELSLKFSHHFVAGPLGRTSGHLWQRRSSAALSGSAAADRALSGSRSAAAAQLCRQPMAEASVVRPSGFRLPSRCRRPSCGPPAPTQRFTYYYRRTSSSSRSFPRTGRSRPTCSRTAPSSCTRRHVHAV